MSQKKYPQAHDPNKVGSYEPIVFSGGGYVYDEVLEYRVWYKEHKKTYCASFVTYDEALLFHEQNRNSELPLALVLQKEHINEPNPGEYILVKKERITEWQPGWLYGAKRTSKLLSKYISD